MTKFVPLRDDQDGIRTLSGFVRIRTVRDSGQRLLGFFQSFRIIGADCAPSPSSDFTRAIEGAKRTSSVLGLKASPQIAIFFPRMLHNSFRTFSIKCAILC